MSSADLAAFLLARIEEDEDCSRYRIGIGDRHGLWQCEPERILAECEAKRRIIEEHASTTRSDPCDAHNANYETIPCDNLLYLAAVYADHPDYREEWRP